VLVYYLFIHLLVNLHRLSLKKAMYSKYHWCKADHTHRIAGTRKFLHCCDVCQTIQWSRQQCTSVKVT